MSKHLKTLADYNTYGILDEVPDIDGDVAEGAVRVVVMVCSQELSASVRRGLRHGRKLSDYAVDTDVHVAVSNHIGDDISKVNVSFGRKTRRVYIQAVVYL